MTQRAPTEAEWEDLLFAWRVCKHVRSNAIVVARDRATVGIGAGQMSRVDSVRLALEKARDRVARRRGARLRRLLPLRRRSRAGDRGRRARDHPARRLDPRRRGDRRRRRRRRRDGRRPGCATSVTDAGSVRLPERAGVPTHREWSRFPHRGTYSTCGAMIVVVTLRLVGNPCSGEARPRGRAPVNAAGACMTQKRELLERVGTEHAIQASALRAAARGEGRVLFLLGSPGLGKTAMLRWAARRAARAAASRSPRRSRARWSEACPSACSARRSSRSAATRSRTSPSWRAPAGSRRASTARCAGSARPPRRARCSLALDDLHWSDPDSLELLGFLCRRLRGLPVLVVGTLRAEPPAAHELAQELAAAAQARTVTLEPLSRDAAARCCARALGRTLAEEEVDELWRACAGTPLLLEAAARSLAEGTPVHRLDHGAAGDATLLLGRFVGRRPRRLTSTSRRARSSASTSTTPRPPRSPASPSTPPTTRSHGSCARECSRTTARAPSPSSTRSSLKLYLTLSLPRCGSAATPRRSRWSSRQGGPDALAAEHAALGRRWSATRSPSRSPPAPARPRSRRARCARPSTHLENAVSPRRRRRRRPRCCCSTGRCWSRRRRSGRCARSAPSCSRASSTPVTRAQALSPAGARRGARQPPAAGAAALHAGRGGRDRPRGRASRCFCDALLTCLASAPARWVLDTGGAGARDGRRRLAPAARAALRPRLRRAGLPLRGRARPPRVAEEVSRAGARSLWSAQGWNLTVAVHALNICKVLEDFERARAIFEREYDEAVAAGAPVLMSGLAVAYADVLLRLGRLDEALELVERTSRAERPPHPAVVGSRSGGAARRARSRRARARAHRLAAALPGGAARRPVRGRRALAAPARRARGARRRASTRRPRSDAARGARSRSSAGASSRAWCRGPASRSPAHLAAGRGDRARALLGELEARAAALPSRWPRAVIALGHAGIAALEGDARAGGRALRDGDRAVRGARPAARARAGADQPSAPTCAAAAARASAREPLAAALAICERARAERLARIARAELGRERRPPPPARRGRLGARPRRSAASRRSPPRASPTARSRPCCTSRRRPSPPTSSTSTRSSDMHSRRELIRRAQEFSHGS